MRFEKIFQIENYFNVFDTGILHATLSEKQHILYVKEFDKFHPDWFYFNQTKFSLLLSAYSKQNTLSMFYKQRL